MTNVIINAAVASESALKTAITAADNETTPGTYEIDITGGIALASALEAINLGSGVSLVISGGTQRGFFVYCGTVDIGNLTIAHAVAAGGAGGSEAALGRLSLRQPIVAIRYHTVPISTNHCVKSVTGHILIATDILCIAAGASGNWKLAQASARRFQDHRQAGVTGWSNEPAIPQIPSPGQRISARPEPFDDTPAAALSASRCRRSASCKRAKRFP